MTTCTNEIGIEIMKRSSIGECVETACRRHGVSMEAFYRWRREFRMRIDAKDSILSGALRRKSSV